MDFMVDFSKTLGRYYSTWVIFDGITKSANFIPIKVNYNSKNLAKIDVKGFMRLHRVLISIIFDSGT